MDTRNSKGEVMNPTTKSREPAERLGRCDWKQYEHCGPHEQIPNVGQRLPPFGCKNWKPEHVPEPVSKRQHEWNPLWTHSETCSVGDGQPKDAPIHAPQKDEATAERLALMKGHRAGCFCNGDDRDPRCNPDAPRLGRGVEAQAQAQLQCNVCHRGSSAFIATGVPEQMFQKLKAGDPCPYSSCGGAITLQRSAEIINDRTLSSHPESMPECGDRFAAPTAVQRDEVTGDFVSDLQPPASAQAGPEPAAFVCMECPYAFSKVEIDGESKDKQWGHKCPLDSNPAMRCESFRQPVYAAPSTPTDIEACLVELRELWPDGSFQIIASSGLPRYQMLVLRKRHLSRHEIFEGASLAECLTAAREFKEKEKENEK